MLGPSTTHDYEDTASNEERQQRNPEASSSVVTSADMFHLMPIEIIHMILGELSVQDMSVFCMASKEIAEKVKGYISSRSWRDKVVIDCFHTSDTLEVQSGINHYKDLSLLFKRCTLFLPTNERLQFFFGMISKIPCFIINQCVSVSCFGFFCYGYALQTLIAGWNEEECYCAFNFICKSTDLLPKVRKAISGTAGDNWYREMQIHFFCRQVLLDPWSNNPDCNHWLIQLLRPLSIADQARLLLILYGPQRPDRSIAWEDLVESELSHNALWELAKVFVVFGNSIATELGIQSMLGLLEEISAIPQQWHMENIARLLVLCGSNNCCNVLGRKAINGKFLEIAQITMYIIMVCQKDRYDMTWVVKLVLRFCKMFCNGTEKYQFIQQLEEQFSAVYREKFAAAITNNIFDDPEALDFINIFLDSSVSFHTKFIQMHLK